MREFPLLSQQAPHRSASDDLAYIRGAIDAASKFTAVPGRGLMAMGGVAAAAVAGSHFWVGAPWEGGRNGPGLMLWLMALTLALGIGSSALLSKAYRMGLSLRSELLRKILLGIVPASSVGGLLTLGMVLNCEHWELLPAVWLGCYGLGVLAAGQYSIMPVLLMGSSFLVLATLSVLCPPTYGLLWLASGFAGLHLVFGEYIARRYDG
jgi:hypothetical protein